MKPDPTNLLNILEISNPLIGFYDTPEKSMFEPFTMAKQCVFSCYQDWIQGKSICLSEQNVVDIECPGAGYWNCNVASVPSEHVAHFLAVEEGLKASHNLMCQWLENQPPYKKTYDYIVVGPFQKEQYEYLKTITFYVDPDQLSLLITGAEYHNASTSCHPVTATFGTGCGQLAAIFNDFNTPQAVIGGTDIAMRPYLPRNILAFTVTKPMFEKLCRLDETSFLHKSFWSNVKQTRLESVKVTQSQEL
ncbi:DUF169 domain-containing protein [Desulfobacterales bacterium HSG17]|nr:DUF169 domain-containing protein [Desulfobacterales bacterium HSG17]